MPPIIYPIPITKEKVAITGIERNAVFIGIRTSTINHVLKVCNEKKNVSQIQSTPACQKSSEV